MQKKVHETDTVSIARERNCFPPLSSSYICVSLRCLLYNGVDVHCAPGSADPLGSRRLGEEVVQRCGSMSGDMAPAPSVCKMKDYGG